MKDLLQEPLSLLFLGTLSIVILLFTAKLLFRQKEWPMSQSKKLTVSMLTTVGIFLIGTFLYVATSFSEQHTCLGLPATIVGTENRDVLEGTSEDDVIVGLGGDDLIKGHGGNDTICGGMGNDTIEGGPGNDTIDGEEGDNIIDGGEDTDFIKAQDGTDTCVNGERVDGCESDLGLLPPDPGEAGKVTLEGIDSDGDGVRDDIQRYIALTYLDSEKTRAALTQLALSIQDALLDADSEEMSITHAIEKNKAIACLVYTNGIDDAENIYDELLSPAMNTEKRGRAYIAYLGQISGQGFSGVPKDERKFACNFDPDALEN
ncbi:MAG: hypothetical protein COU90_00395 [Candidatus Ryanbacteria bacterium CG10_big_fil_rev_8_21_14_0_10_43_42]|uniref:Calcium-binding protein n=1 Tax=Candidatus Ryanbacteria bacterium CG10_big_fil_rev_8_21_14_0_10_43_42 TaxID=1974864 RepID=A0A2M8KXR8_9BACT|nr:MAG: hypothetical protein COU90_00395 [Candidatus Ryanbacteria bacterium CG10_big_fil_rev_8_21_14_0_10_43_42]